MSPRATVPGYRRSRRPRSPAPRIWTAIWRLRTAQGSSAVEMVLNARGSCEQAGLVGWGEPGTSQRNSLSRPPGRREGAHVTDERLGRMFWAGRHARYLFWSPEERGPGSGAPPLAWSPLPAPSKSGVVHQSIRSDGGLQPRESGSWYCSGTQCPREQGLRTVGALRRPLSGHFENSRSEKREKREVGQSFEERLYPK